jgi:hypothetical protein
MIRQTGLIGGDILLTLGYQNGGKNQFGLLSGLVLLRLVVPPLQPGLAGPYPVWGSWFPRRLQLEGTEL